MMAEGRRSENWNWWAEHLALVANCNRNPKKTKPFSADKIHPYRKRKRKKSGDVAELHGAMKAKYGSFGQQQQNRQNTRTDDE